MRTFTLFPDTSEQQDDQQREREAAAAAIVDALNPAQQEAVTVADGPVLIVAGPGSGKTRVLTHRVAYLIAAGKSAPYQILALTFTNKAAREMKSRIQKLVPEEAGARIWMGTFHSIFARVMRREAEKIGYSSDFSIYDSDDSERVVRELMNDKGIDTKQFSPRMIRSLISSAKNQMVGPSQYARLAASLPQDKAAEIYGPYEQVLRTANALDFDDLLLKPLQLFQEHEDVLAQYQDRWRYIHIDEYQDTNHAQYRLAKLLAGKYHNLCVVGDDAQSIYAFRGADIANILSFQRDYPDATVVRLEQNYRSTKTILRVADAIIKNNRDQLDKSLWTENGDGEEVILIEGISERDEALKLEHYIRDLKVRHGYGHSDFAILYRTNSQSRAIEDALRRGGIPYRVIGGISFYQRREIKDVLAYLRLIVNENDIASLRRIVNYPTRGIGAKSMQKIEAFASAQNIPLWQALRRVEETGVGPRAINAVKGFVQLIESFRQRAATEPVGPLTRDLIIESGLKNEYRREHSTENLVRWENVQELVNAIAEFTAERSLTVGDSESPGPTRAEIQGQSPGTPAVESREHVGLSEFLQEVSLFTDADAGDDLEDRVTLMTLHASKGLEFACVFVTGLEEGLFPLARSLDDPKDLEEERRLFYVGVTRAEQRLFLTMARSRFRFGEQMAGIPSRFLEEVDAEVVKTEAGQQMQRRSNRFSASRDSSGRGSGGRSGRGGGTGGTGGDWVEYETLDPDYYKASLRPPGPSGSRSSAGSRSGRRVVLDEGEGELGPGVLVEHDQFGAGKILAIDGVGQQAQSHRRLRRLRPQEAGAPFCAPACIGTPEESARDTGPRQNATVRVATTTQ